MITFIIRFSIGVAVIDFFFLDRIRINLNILTCWVSLLMIFSRIKIYKHNEYFFEFCVAIILLMVVLFLTFFINDLFSFYFFLSSLSYQLLLLL